MKRIGIGILCIFLLLILAYFLFSYFHRPVPVWEQEGMGGITTDERPGISDVIFEHGDWKRSRSTIATDYYFKLFVPSDSPDEQNQPQIGNFNFDLETEYAPLRDGFEKIIVTYSKDKHAPLNNSIKEVLKKEAKLSCKSKQHQIFEENDKVVSFVTEISGCQGEQSSAITVHKIFQQPEGQYTITYSADPSKLSQDRVSNMKDRILAAYMLKRDE